MGTFIEENMTLKMIPHVLAWVGRAEEDLQSHSAMFSLLKEMPTLCAPVRPHHSVDTSEKTWYSCGVVNEYAAKRQQPLRKGKSKLGSFLGSVPRRFKGGMKDYKQKVVYSRAA